MSLSTSARRRLTAASALLLSLLPGVAVRVLPCALLSGVTLYSVLPARAQQTKYTLQPKTDYRRQNLSNLDCSGSDGSNSIFLATNFTSTNLSNTDLHGAVLYGANLHNANLSNANLYNANLYNADLRNTGAGAITSDQMRQAFDQLSSVNLSGNNLSGFVLANADLTNADLTGGTFTGADLTGANLSGAILPAALPSLPVISGATVNVTNDLAVAGSVALVSGGTL